MKRVLILAMSAVASASFGQMWMEMGNAGGVPSTANMTMGSGNLASIMGSLSTAAGAVDREDMYCINVTSPGTFSASTFSGFGTGGAASFDTQLFLFNSAGVGVVFNDDDAGGTSLQSTILAFSGSPGIYYLAISNYDNDPLSAGGAIFPDTPFGGQNGPTGPGGGAPISSWDASSTGATSTLGAYTIGLTGASYCVVPEPGTMIALAAGLGAIAARRRRRK